MVEDVFGGHHFDKTAFLITHSVSLTSILERFNWQVSRDVKRFRNYISSHIFYTIFFKKIRGEGGSYLVIAQEIVIWWNVFNAMFSNIWWLTMDGTDLFNMVWGGGGGVIEFVLWLIRFSHSRYVKGTFTGTFLFSVFLSAYNKC